MSGVLTGLSARLPSLIAHVRSTAYSIPFSSNSLSASDSKPSGTYRNNFLYFSPAPVSLDIVHHFSSVRSPKVGLISTSTHSHTEPSPLSTTMPG